MGAATPKWANDLLSWYRQQARVLPWRERSTPYRIWVSEVMLQQTQVDTVIPYFERFLQRFPTIDALAAADLQCVLKQWEGLGYYSRARNFHRAAQSVVANHGGEIPSSYDQLITLAGLGPYTAAAVASIAFAEPRPVVDGNVLRVMTRFWEIAEDIRGSRIKKTLVERLSPVVASVPPGEFNQALMELGALVCRKKSPACASCPIAAGCGALAHGRVQELPLKSKRPKVPHKEIAVGVIWRDERILIGRRRTDQMLGGLWEFPGGKRKPDETLEQTALREIREETDLEVRIDARYGQVKHAYSHFKITLTAFRCQYLSGQARPRSTDELRWVRLGELDQYPFPTANKRVIAQIRDFDSGVDQR